jgi:hypothetical protein
MIPKRPAQHRRQNPKGNRRKFPLDERSCGWRARPRTKVSHYADRGFLFEVRLEHYRAWDDFPKGSIGVRPVTSQYDAILDQIKAGTNCRIVGRYGQRVNDGCTKRNIRIYLRTEQDLFFLRLIQDDVFRVYRLVSPNGTIQG